MMNKMDNLTFSIGIPVYNRPKEIEELLESLANQTNKEFEVIIVEDGSTLTCEKEVEKFKARLKLKYFYKENSGPALSRNYACERADGNYYIFLDSDCIAPPHYFEVVRTALDNDFVDAFGGPDSAHDSFTNLQKAINYSMTSFLTTGGIRGGGEKLDKFYPRSFNMGFSKDVFNTTKGFPSAKFASVKAAGEDIELSINIRKHGFKIGLLKDAYVFHKRRINLSKFLKQVYNFGYARIILFTRNNVALKFIHALPAIFTIGVFLICLLVGFVSVYFLIPIVLFSLLLFFDASIKNRSFIIGSLAVLTSCIQFIGYGTGFIVAFWKKIILKNVSSQ